MSRFDSYTKIEREVTPKFRESMGLAESTADVPRYRKIIPGTST